MVFEKVTGILAGNLGIDASKITSESTFEDLGLDSLDTVDLLMSIEEEFGVSIEPSESLKTVGDVVNEIKKLGVNE
ncbi:MAG: acyl carrier protein [Bacillales bacterium]|jgi:acyl carrier protein|nr:acyl carrier protein [Bacillales bacterium]